MATKTVKRNTKKKVAKKTAKPSKVRYQHREGFYGGEVISRWQAAFNYRVVTLKKHILISCSEAMEQLRDDSGKCPFSDWDIKKNQWRLQRMFTQLEADNFKDPTKGEMYIMLYELYYGTQTFITKDGESVEIEPSISDRILIAREMLKMGGHYAAEKTENTIINRTEKYVIEVCEKEAQKRLEKMKGGRNRIKDIM